MNKYIKPTPIPTKGKIIKDGYPKDLSKIVEVVGIGTIILFILATGLFCFSTISKADIHQELVSFCVSKLESTGDQLVRIMEEHNQKMTTLHLDCDINLYDEYVNKIVKHYEQLRYHVTDISYTSMVIRK